MLITQYAWIAKLCWMFWLVLLEGRPACLCEVKHHGVNFLPMVQLPHLRRQASTLRALLAHEIPHTLPLFPLHALPVHLYDASTRLQALLTLLAPPTLAAFHTLLAILTSWTLDDHLIAASWSSLQVFLTDFRRLPIDRSDHLLNVFLLLIVVLVDLSTTRLFDDANVIDFEYLDALALSQALAW